MSVSFLPPMLAPPARRDQVPPLSATASANSNSNNELTPTGTSANLDFPPVTPMPQPSVKEGEEQYAGIEGQVVWEGDVVDRYKLFREPKGGWVAVWKGEVHVGEFLSPDGDV